MRLCALIRLQTYNSVLTASVIYKGYQVTAPNAFAAR